MTTWFRLKIFESLISFLKSFLRNWSWNWMNLCVKQMITKYNVSFPPGSTAPFNTSCRLRHHPDRRARPQPSAGAGRLSERLWGRRVQRRRQRHRHRQRRHSQRESGHDDNVAGSAVASCRRRQFDVEKSGQFLPVFISSCQFLSVIFYSLSVFWQFYQFFDSFISFLTV